MRTSLHNVRYYVTDSRCENAIYCFTDAEMVRNSHLEKVSGDALQNSRLVLNSTLHNIDGDALVGHHTDVFQYFGHHENIIVYGFQATAVNRTQGIFLDGHKSSFKDIAFVNVGIESLVKGPPFSQLLSQNDHVLLLHVANPGQIFILRDDPPAAGKFVARNVKIANSIFRFLTRGAKPRKGLPAGVTVSNSHFIQGEKHGTNPTFGPLKLSAAPGGRFIYEGQKVADIMKSRHKIHGISVTDWEFGSQANPNRGAFPFGEKRETNR